MSFTEEEGAGTTQRRSRAEMVCDLMFAISNGAVRPTRIMQRANLTWNALLIYLNALAMNGLVRREERGNVSTYHLTEEGKQTLGAYLTLKKRLEPLKLEAAEIKSAVPKPRPPASRPAEAPEREALTERLRAEGYRILPRSLMGKSGVAHEFTVVARDRAGAVHGYLFAARPDEKLVLGQFITQLDTGVKVHIAHMQDPEPAAVARAREYGVELDRVAKPPAEKAREPG